MKFLHILGILLAISVNDIAKINTLKQEAKSAYEAGDYETALEKYKELTNDYEVSSDEISLNMAHIHYHQQDTSSAMLAYNELALTAADPRISSVAYNQVGVIQNQMDTSGKNDKVALKAFKEALKADPTNAEARYNYEVLKKKMKEKEDQNKDQQNQDQDKEEQDKEDEEKEQEKDQQDKGDQEKEQENKDQQEKQEEKEDGEQQENQDQEGEGEDQDQKDGEQEEGKEDEGEQKDGEEQENEQEKESEADQEAEEDKEKEGMPKSAADKLKEMNISPQQAKMILEAMKDQEVQYLQQLRRRPTKRRQSGKPDW